MELGFETVGNATLVCHDSGPVLVTDPWLDGPAYFGSWGMSHQIPEAQRAAIAATGSVWVSHGHPDHLSFESLLPLRDKRIYISDHVGRRIVDFLLESGFTTTIMRDRQWVRVSPRIRMQSLAHYNQDSILLVDLDGTLIINMNDAPSTVWHRYIRRVAQQYRKVVLLKLECFGDADMNNFFDESGRRIPSGALKRPPLGRAIARNMRTLGADISVPFSSMHRYQRADSAWANELTPRLDEYSVGFDPAAGELLPAFVAYDLVRDDVTELRPEPSPAQIHDSKTFGDDWSEPLSREDVVAVKAYFERRPLLGQRLDFIRFLVGGEELVIGWSARQLDGVTFEVPRGSLMTAVKYAVFDDLFIGNFMRTTLHGKLQVSGLYPSVNPYLGKWADNGLVESKANLRAYLGEYFKRAPLPYLFGRLDDRATYAVKAHVPRNSEAYDFLRRVGKTVRSS